MIFVNSILTKNCVAEYPTLTDIKNPDLIGRFIREIGPAKLEEFLYDPQAPDKPGVRLSTLIKLIDSTDNIDNLITIVKESDDLQSLIYLTNSVSGIKLGHLISNTQPYKLIAQLEAILLGGENAVPGVELSDLAGLLNRIPNEHIYKLAIVLNNIGSLQISGTYTFDRDIVFMADMMAGLNGTAGGVGEIILSDLFSALENGEAALNLALITKGLNDYLIYNGNEPNITRLEGMVRILSVEMGSGVRLLNLEDINPTADDIDFPGLGTHETAFMIGSLGKALTNLLNSSNIAVFIAGWGCNSHVGAEEQTSGEWIWMGLPEPDFESPCRLIENWK
jgi:hypothetical protein